MNKVVTIIGCFGYIGATLTQKLLRRGYEVRGIDNFLYKQQKETAFLLDYPGFKFRNTDGNQIDNYKDFLKGSDAVFPLSAIVGAPACDKAPELAQITNEDSIKALVEYLPSQTHILFPNSNSAFGSSSEVVTEESPFNPLSHYAVTKCNAENAVLTHEKSSVLRLATVFGLSPRQRMDLMVNDFCARLNYHKKLDVFDPQFYRNFVHVKDVARAFIHCLESEAFGVYNVGVANLTKLDLAQYIALKAGLPPEVVTVGDGKDPDQRNCIISSDKLKKTGFEYKYDLGSVSNILAYCRLFSYADLRRMSNV